MAGARFARRLPDAATLDGHAAYRKERERLEAVGRAVPDDEHDPLRADPEQLSLSRFGLRCDGDALLTQGLEMLRRLHEED